MNANSRLTAVVDTNLFVSGTIQKHGALFELLEAWRSGAFVILLAAKQDIEIRDVLSRPKIRVRYRLTSEEIETFYTELARITRRVDLLDTLPLEIRDPKDRQILAAALGGDADYVISGDDDLLILAGDSRLGRLQIVNVRQFLGILETLQTSG